MQALKDEYSVICCTGLRKLQTMEKTNTKKPQFLLEVNDENSWSQALDPDNLVFGQLWLTKELLLRPAKGKQKNEYWDNITDKY